MHTHWTINDWRKLTLNAGTRISRVPIIQTRFDYSGDASSNTSKEDNILPHVATILLKQHRLYKPNKTSEYQNLACSFCNLNISLFAYRQLLSTLRASHWSHFFVKDKKNILMRNSLFAHNMPRWNQNLASSFWNLAIRLSPYNNNNRQLLSGAQSREWDDVVLAKSRRSMRIHLKF